MTKVDWIGSPNFDTTRKPIVKVVIHWIVGNLASADAQFQKTTPGTSAHYGVEDNTVHQYVKEEHTAYHAGVYDVNQESIGIEHSAAPDRPASEATYQTSGKLIGEICKRYNIPIDNAHIIKHSSVKATQCPGTMDIDRLIAIAKNSSMEEYYKGYNLADRGSMKVAVDILVRVQAGEFIEKTTYDKDLKERNDTIQKQGEEIGRLNERIKELESTPQIPPAPPVSTPTPPVPTPGEIPEYPEPPVSEPVNTSLLNKLLEVLIGFFEKISGKNK